MKNKRFHECPIINSTPETATHFFGFHDLCPWDKSNQKLLVHRIKNPGLMHIPTHQDIAEVCWWDTKTGEINAFDETTAWNWHQGSRLQWLPHTNDKVLYNKQIDGKLVGIIKNLTTSVEQILPFTCYAISSDGRYGISPNFGRLHQYYSTYGYDGIATGSEPELLPANDGIFLIDLVNYQAKLLLPLAEIAALGNYQTAPNTPHFVTHPVFNPSGTRFSFFHRFFLQDGALYSRFMVADINGSNLAIIAEEKVSHFDWYNDDTLLVWTRYLPKKLAESRRIGILAKSTMKSIIRLIRKLQPHLKQTLWHEAYFQISLNDIENPKALATGLLEQDGHPMFSQDRKWLLTDTYPNPKDQCRSLILFDYKKRVRYDIKRLYSPLPFQIQGISCDLHPRWNHSGTQVCVDSTHTGSRQIHVIDVSSLTGKVNQ